MSVKKVGKAKLDLESEVWRLEGGKEGAFLVSRRLIDHRQEIKSVKSAFAKQLQKDTPSLRRPNKRADYFQSRDEYRKQMTEALSKIYEEIVAESDSSPVLLRREKDYDHHIDWRYCLYRGVVYQFDRPGYTGEEMIQQIEALASVKPRPL